MQLIARFALCTGLLFAAASPSRSGGGDAEVVNAWSRATAPGVSVGVVYFEIVNPGPADTLFAIETPRAYHVSLHTVSMSDGMMQMREVESVEIPAGDRIVFSPGGRHAMLMGLKEPLRAGDRIPLTLVLRRAGRLRAEAAVRGADALSAVD